MGSQIAPGTWLNRVIFEFFILFVSTENGINRYTIPCIFIFMSNPNMDAVLSVNRAVRRTCNFKSKIRFLALVPPLVAWSACSWAAGIDQTTRASALDPAARIREENRYFHSAKINRHSLNSKLETTYFLL